MVRGETLTLISNSLVKPVLAVTLLFYMAGVAGHQQYDVFGYFFLSKCGCSLFLTSDFKV